MCATPEGAHPSAEMKVFRETVVSIVDDDESIRESLHALIEAFGFESHAFYTAEEFLESFAPDATACVILDVGLPGMSGVDLFGELERSGFAPPIIFITADRDDALRERLLTMGAIDCLFKPFSESELRNALNRAIGAP